ncbi:PQQ-binding-like beta-propeller repeat protein [Actinoplanes subtropicus]|uniref:outer membrane protein assembly factor BamB family protein n=1 Tax=Actinoplanes subtropicus TaxID=543632 RepID=UPI000A6400F0|nr:PQQ-binding-like beta-propeller repeat protein [Actinoplanes subtropicus]
MTHAVIDLGEAPADLPVRSRPVPYRALLGALSAVLLALAGGAARQRAPVAPTVLPAGLADTFTLDGERMYLVEGERISTYELPSMRVLARTAATASGTVGGAQQAGGAMVVSYQVGADGTPATAAYLAGGDRLLWRRPERLVATSAADGTALLNADGAEVAVDLTTGRERWRVAQPVKGFLAEAGPEAGGGYPDWLVAISGTGRLATYDAHTGRPLAAVTRPAFAGEIWPVGSYLLVSAGDGYDGYRLPGLRRLWHTTADLSQSWMQTDCGGVICAFRQQGGGMTVLDPADGHVLWSSGRWACASPVGRYLVATPSAAEGDVPPLWVLDPRTGKEWGNFGAWQGLGLAPGGLVYGRREVRGRYQIFYGLLDPADRSIDVLGSAEGVSNGCETGGGVLACRLVDASVAVWPLR